ncbi:LysR family transcriptional regulator [Flexibacterium corallicola]|uniref:LysR family transcriptional regulator n=1 Tax=Flexibacterium corallicola TaxID=3037259 RepID=UPI00286EDC05|nr:LysR family transcriptional regulator [Pseudovibrio sp. M1P-2-3]
MNWDDTRIFLRVARCGQFLSAAQRLGINHATVARRMTALEASLQTKLLERRTTGCALTSEGEEFLRFAEGMEAQMLEAQARIGGSSIQLSGSVRIGAPDGFGGKFLAAHLGELSQTYPDLTLQLVPLHRSFSLSRREADIAITVGRPDHGRLISKKLVDYSLRLYASKSYLEKFGAPVNKQDLTNHRLIGYVEDLVYTPALNYAHEVLKDWHAPLELSSALAQTEAVKSGHGIAILHAFIANREPELEPVLPELTINRSYWLAYHESARGQKRIEATCDFLYALIARHRAIF